MVCSLCVYRRQREKERVLETRKVLWKERKDKRNYKLFFLRNEGIVREQGAEMDTSILLCFISSLNPQINRFLHGHYLALFHYFVHFCVPFAQPLKFKEEGERITLYVALGRAVFIS